LQNKRHNTSPAAVNKYLSEYLNRYLSEYLSEYLNRYLSIYSNKDISTRVYEKDLDS